MTIKIVTERDAAARKAWDSLSREARILHMAPIHLALLSAERLESNLRRDQELRVQYARQFIAYTLMGSVPTFDDLCAMSLAVHNTGALDWAPGLDLGVFLNMLRGIDKVVEDAPATE